MGSAGEPPQNLSTPLLTTSGDGSGDGDKHPLPTSSPGPTADSAAHGASGQLESVLTDGSVPLGRRVWLGSVIEMRLLVHLAAPAVLVYMLNYVMSMATQIFSGHLGTLELAAASLGNTGIQVFAYGLMVRTYPSFPMLMDLYTYTCNSYVYVRCRCQIKSSQYTTNSPIAYKYIASVPINFILFRT